MSYDYQTEAKIASEQRRILARKAISLDDFLLMVRDTNLFDSRDDAEGYYEAYLENENQEDIKAGGN